MGFMGDEQTENAVMSSVYIPRTVHATSYLEVMRVNVLVVDPLVRTFQYDK